MRRSGLTLTVIGVLLAAGVASAQAEGTLSLYTDYSKCYDNYDTTPEGGNWILVTLDVTLPPPGADLSLIHI